MRVPRRNGIALRVPSGKSQCVFKTRHRCRSARQKQVTDGRGMVGMVSCDWTLSPARAMLPGAVTKPEAPNPVRTARPASTELRGNICLLIAPTALALSSFTRTLSRPSLSVATNAASKRWLCGPLTTHPAAGSSAALQNSCILLTGRRKCIVIVCCTAACEQYY